ncbi:hypothetical protein T10_4429 [Trichinella papuae]|uniref:Uncharacterized protein n=1 Tax=Trichinella papuae TaxID=268474 RepID=A0A0V1MMC4_9BILA|nr:hypothetical protein T10_4429 [Trichinella papuae]
MSNQGLPARHATLKHSQARHSTFDAIEAIFHRDRSTIYKKNDNTKASAAGAGLVYQANALPANDNAAMPR